MVLKLPANPNFPSQVVAISPIVVVKSGGTYTFSIDSAAFLAWHASITNTQIRATVSDANYAVAAPIRYIAYIGLTQTRTVTLAPAAGYVAGAEIIVADESGACSPTVRIHVQATGTEKINGGTALDIEMPYGVIRLVSNGVDRYNTYP